MNDNKDLSQQCHCQLILSDWHNFSVYKSNKGTLCFPDKYSNKTIPYEIDQHLKQT